MKQTDRSGRHKKLLIVLVLLAVVMASAITIKNLDKPRLF